MAAVTRVQDRKQRLGIFSNLPMCTWQRGADGSLEPSSPALPFSDITPSFLYPHVFPTLPSLYKIMMLTTKKMVLVMTRPGLISWAVCHTFLQALDYMSPKSTNNTQAVFEKLLLEKAWILWNVHWGILKKKKKITVSTVKTWQKSHPSDIVMHLWDREREPMKWKTGNRVVAISWWHFPRDCEEQIS